MWCCVFRTLLSETPTASLYQYKNKVEKIVYNTELFENELIALKALSHPNIISIEKVYKKSIIMKYYPRGDMYYYIKNGLPEYVVQHYGKQLIDALVYCHKMGVSHRDVKPDNLLLTEEWDIKLCDFGLSSIKSLEDTYCGTPDYAPPEVIARIPYDPMLADTWSYGVTLYAMFMGMLPWNGWRGSKKGKEFIDSCLQKDRSYLYQMEKYSWLKYDNVAPYMSKIEIK